MLALQADIIGQISAAERAEGRLRDAAAVAEQELQAARRDVAHHALALRLGDTGLEESLAADIVAIRAELELLRTRGQLQRARNQLEDALHMPLSGPELSLLRAARPPVPGS
jgi:outer membrane protein TolC